MKKTPEQLNADSLFAFQMAMKGHKQFEWKSIKGIWHKTHNVSSGPHHRIHHDIPGGWTRHDGEDWKGDKDAVIEEVIWCDGQRCEVKDKKATWWANVGVVNNWTTEPEVRIYAYKLAKPSISIPEGFTKWDGGECPVAPDTKVEYMRRDHSTGKDEAKHLRWNHQGMEWNGDIIAYRVIPKKVVPWTFETAPLCLKVQRKSDGEQFRCETYPSSALLLSKGMLKPSYETLASDYLQLNGEVCGTEVEQ